MKSSERRVVVVGGAGRVGVRLVELLQQSGRDVVVSDVTAPSTRIAAPFIETDISQPGSLARALDGADVVVNTVGPFDHWGTTVLDAALAAGASYVDVCDDPAATMAMLDRRAVASDAGVAAVVGMGSTPGMSNLLALIAASSLDVCDELAVFWGSGRAATSAPDAQALAEGWARFFRGSRAAIVHFFEQITGTVPIWHEGKRMLARPWQRPIAVDAGHGRTGSYRLVGHPEPLTLPATLAVPRIVCLGTCGTKVDERLAIIAQQVNSGALPVVEAGDAAASLLEADPSALVSPPTGAPIDAFVGVVAQGMKDGSPATAVALPSGATNGSLSVETARPAALAVEFLNQVAPGVHAAETALEPNTYMRAYAERHWGGDTGVDLHVERGWLVDMGDLAADVLPDR